jgi:PBP1b-binding outer membrane lipoprotein LpoB
LGLIAYGVLMSVWRKCTVIAPVSLSVALLLASCSESKVAQCERLIKAVDKGTALIDKNKGQQVTTSLQLSKDLEAVTKEIADMNFKDPKLKEYQGGFVKVFQTLSQAISKAAKALGSAKTAEASSTGRAKIQQARGEIDNTLTSAAKTVGKDADTLETEFKKYCSEKE